MERAVRSRHFVERVFRPEEIAYAEAKGNVRARAASYASAFAAREAFCKASGVSLAVAALGEGVALTRRGGPPKLELSPALRESLEAALAGPFSLWVSLTHDGDYAVAAVVIERAAGSDISA